MKRLDRIEGVMIHHSATPDGSARDADGIRRFHMQPALNGETITREQHAAMTREGVTGLRQTWEDVGYHYLIEMVRGEVQVILGRSTDYQGAHCPAVNATHLGICIVGNYDLAPPPDALLKAASNLIRSLMTTHRFDLRGVLYHCDYSTKTCPGAQFPKGGFLLEIAGESRP